MKVIAQLVRHFWQRGVLSSEEAAYLVRHGFVRARDLPGYQGLDRPMVEEMALEPFYLTEPIGPPEGLELVEEQLIRRSSRGRRSGKPRGKVLEEKDLCRRVQKELHRRATELTELVTLAEPLAPCGDWASAAVALRRISPHRFNRELVATLRTEEATLRGLWRATDVEPFHRLVQDREVRGRAANAYTALLVAPDAAGLGKYAWMLKHDEMQAVNNLRAVYRRLLASLNRLYHRDRRLLVRALEPGCDPSLFWGLVLLHNANHVASDRRPSPAREYGPLEQPGDDTWRQAWTMAMSMDRPAATKLLLACYRDPRHRRGRTAGVSDYPLYCPVGWHAPNEETAPVTQTV